MSFPLPIRQLVSSNRSEEHAHWESAESAGALTMPVPDQNDRYYQLSFLWSKDREKSERYLEILRDAMTSCGAKYERQFVTDMIIASGVEKPDGISLAQFPSLKAFIEFQHDERLREYMSLRRVSLCAATIEGRSVLGGDLLLDLRERQYLIEIARVAPADPDAYQRYAEQAAPVLDRYGYRVERVLQPDFTSGLPFRVGVVKIACFDIANGFIRLQADPDFHKLMGWYREATRDFIWVIGKLADARVVPSRAMS